MCECVESQEMARHDAAWKAFTRGFCYTCQSVPSGKTHQAAPDDTHPQTKFGEWLSLVEHLVRDQGVGGSNPLSPTIKSRNFN